MGEATLGLPYGIPRIFQDGMVLQRDKEIKVWGTAPSGTVVRVALGEASVGASDDVGSSGDMGDSCREISSAEVGADQDGHFLATLPPHGAGEGFEILIAFPGEDWPAVRIKDVRFGEVWLAGGQSNMEFPLKYDRDWETVRKLPRNPKIHLYNVPQVAYTGQTGHNEQGYGYWMDDGDRYLETFSAPAYSFARELQPKLGVPIGIIGCNWGGSTAAAWVPEEILMDSPLDAYLKEYEDAVASYPSERLEEDSMAGWAFENSEQHRKDFEPVMYGIDREAQLAYTKAHAGEPLVPMGPFHFNRPSGLYHTMLEEVIPYPIRGVIWYQGESDAGDRAKMYDRLFSALIQCWREKWDDPFPFLAVQLAPFGEWLECDSQGYALVREQQSRVAKSLPDVYLAGIMDLGSYYDIHPKEKMEVGRRLALLALGHVYGQGILCDAPEGVEATLLADRRIEVAFRNADGLALGEGANDFAIHFGEREMVPASVSIEGGRVTLAMPEEAGGMGKPSSVSLGWKDYAEIHLHNSAGLTAMPFQLRIGS